MRPPGSSSSACTPRVRVRARAGERAARGERARIRYPVGLDNRYATWAAYANQGWPAEYLIDRGGHIRHVHLGEGAYAETERLIRTLLAEPTDRLPVSSRLPDPTPHGQRTPETYLGAARLDARYMGSEIRPAFWRATGCRPTSTSGKRLRLPRHVAGPPRSNRRRRRRAPAPPLPRARPLPRRRRARRLRVLVDGKPTRRLVVSGIARLRVLLRYRSVVDGLLELRFSPGIAAYALTFG